MFNKLFSDKKNITILITALIGSLLYLSLIFNNNLWVDEAFTASLIRGSLSEVWKATAADTLPPFYNLFTKLLTLIAGYSAPVMKFSSVLAMILLLFYGIFEAKKLFSFEESLIFALLVLSMPYFFYYAVEIRPYSWGLFFAFAAALAFKEIMLQHKLSSYLKFAFFSALSGYAHHYALIASAILWFCLFIHMFFDIKKLIRPFIISALVFLVLYIPCLILAIYQIKNASSYFSMSPLTLSSFFSDLRFPFVTHFTPLSLLLMLIFTIAFIYGSVRFILKKEYILFCPLLFSACPFIVTVFGYLISFAAGSSYFTSRYLVPSLGIFWLGNSVLLYKLISSFNGLSKKILCLIVAISVISSGIINYRSQFLSEYDLSVNDMTDWFDNNLSRDDGYIIYEDAFQIEICMRYYYPELKKYEYDNIEEIKGNIWYFEVAGYEDELEKFKDLGYNIVYIKPMSFDRYSFNLYKLEK